MGQFTKVYSRTFHPEETFVLSWDSGYKNVCIYDQDRLVRSWSEAGQFMKGVSFQDEHIGKILLKFTETRPLQLELKVNGKKYKPNKDGKQTVDVTGVISLFYAMAAFTGIVFAIVLIGLAMRGANPIVAVTAGITAFITLIYIASALLISKKYYWGYFLGTIYMTFSTIYYLWVSLTFQNMGLLQILCIFRIIALIYLFISMRKIIFAAKMDTNEKPEELLDEKF